MEWSLLMSGYLLQPYTYVCLTPDAIFLDLRRDEYLGLTEQQSALLGAVIQGWPTPGESAPGEDAKGSLASLLDTLLKKGLLTQDLSVGKRATPPRLPRVESRFVDLDTTPRPQVSLGHVASFALAYAQALRASRFLALESIVNGARRRKQRRGRPIVTPEDVAEARNLVNVFLCVRPFFYTFRDRCLFDSLVLVNFLARRGLQADWVFAVKTNPFGAHCWVQHGAWILNGPPELARGFTPIMTV
jgi:Transglutaminase-like superfamily